MKLLHDKILVKPEKRVQSTILDVQSAEANTLGTIVAVSDESAAQGLSVGDKIAYGTLAKDYKDEYLKWNSIEFRGEKCLKMSWKDVCFVIEDENGKSTLEEATNA